MARGLQHGQRPLVAQPLAQLVGSERLDRHLQHRPVLRLDLVDSDAGAAAIVRAELRNQSDTSRQDTDRITQNVVTEIIQATRESG